MPLFEIAVIGSTIAHWVLGAFVVSAIITIVTFKK